VANVLRELLLTREVELFAGERVRHAPGERIHDNALGNSGAAQLPLAARWRWGEAPRVGWQPVDPMVGASLEGVANVMGRDGPRRPSAGRW